MSYLIEIDFNQLEGVTLELARYLRDNADRIHKARLQKGGWEAWLQVEIATAFSKPMGMEYDILREQPIYDRQQRVDIWAVPVPLRHCTIPYIGIELKVESEYQTGTGKTLRARFKDDILKCSVGPKNDFRTGYGTQLFSVGITSLKSDLDGYGQIASETDQVICYCNIVEDNEYDIRNIIMLWWAKEFRQ